jgi:uncharacterized protein (DUF1778 family)
MAVTEDSQIAVRLSSDHSALLHYAAQIEGTSITQFMVGAAVAHACEVLADRRLFALYDTAWTEFLGILDRPVLHKPRLEWLFATPAVFDEP